MNYTIKMFAFLIVLGFTILFMSYDDAFAVCCFPYDMIHYVDPSTGNLVVSGELWNDSYKVEPFGNGKYDFVLVNSTGDTLFEREILITDGHPVQNGFVINPHGAHPLPFQIIMEDIDAEVLSQVAHVGTGRTSVDYFSWKPADLNVTVEEFKKIETIQGKTHDALFDKWQVHGIITNTHYDATQNVYVLASLYDSDDGLVGVAGYSNDDIHPITLNGYETKEFKIHALVPQEKSVEQVRLYAESDNSSMKYPNTKPIIIKPDPPIRHGMEGTSIPIHVNVTNISRENVTFDWILQIKKSPKNLDEGDITKYPESKVVFIDTIPVDITTQESRILEYLWIPETKGIYFYEMYLLDKGKPVSLSFAGSSFLYSDQILVTSNSLKDQLASGTSFENLQCMGNLVLIQRHDEFPACVTPITKQHLIDRGWAKTIDLQEVKNNPDLLPLNIIRIEDGRISLHPENTCASIDLDLLSEHDIQRYRNDKRGLDDTNILQITSDDLKEIPIIQELIYAVHSIDFPYNKHSSAYLDGITFVEYEFFLMNNAIEKYGDSQENYFIKLDTDYKERFSNPAKQGFSNTFEAPMILYNNIAYSVSGTIFWTSDEHEPMRLTVSPKYVIDKDEKFIILTDDDFKSVPKIKEAIEGIGTIRESITGIKGLPENEWSQYMEWFAQKSQDTLRTDSFRLIEYNDQLYSVGFGIC